MAKYSYNGVELPKLPTSEYPYAAIFGDTGGHLLVFQQSPFVAGTGGGVSMAQASPFKAYFCAEGETRWGPGTVTGGSLAGGYFGILAAYIWSNEDIVNRHDSDKIVFEGSDPVLISPDVPVITAFGWTDDDKDASIRDVELPQGAHLTLNILMTAEVEEGTLTADWYVNGEKHDTHTGETSLTSILRYFPIPETIGSEYTYKCVVTNTLEGLTSTTESATLTLKLVDPLDDGDDDPESGGGDYPEGGDDPEGGEDTPVGFDLQSWLTGLAVGLAGKPLPFAKTEVETNGQN